MQAVIIAGGKGTRLRPYTNILPKPLLPIGLRSILEINLRQLKAAGVDHVIIAVGYLGELIEGVIGNGEKFGLRIAYSYESEPLGTTGALGLVKNQLDENLIVMNGDILHDVDIRSLLNTHIEQTADTSVTVYRKKHQLHLGVLHITDNKITEYVEKPTSAYFVSTGIYALKKTTIDHYVKENTYLDFPMLINQMIKDNKFILPFFHKGIWIDLGTEEEYQHVLDNIESIKSKYPSIPILL